MFRLFCVSLLLTLAVSLCNQTLYRQKVFAQQDIRFVDDQVLLRQMQDDITRQLQETQKMLGLVGQHDRQLSETLQAQQADLIRQLRDVIQHLQPPPGGESRLPREAERSTGLAGKKTEEGTPGRFNDSRVSDSRVDDSRVIIHPNTMDRMTGRWPEMSGRTTMPRGLGAEVSNPPDANPTDDLMPPYDPTPLANPFPHQQPNPFSERLQQEMERRQNQHRELDSLSWGPRLPREIVEMRQSLEALRREVGELQETIKALETQIQLLNRNILLFDRVRAIDGE